MLTGEVGSMHGGKIAATDESACSFTLGIAKDGGYKTWVRVNVYGRHVEYCQTRLQQGSRVLVQGELMNRRPKAVGSGELSLTEVRCFDVTKISET